MFEVLFEKGRRFESATVDPVDAGTLRITSGTIAVCDPSSDGSDGVLERAVPNGAFPVLVSRAHFPERGVRAIAAAMVRFTEQRVAEWQPALPRGKDARDLEPGQHFGYGVDAATACFVDGALASQLDLDHFEAHVTPKLRAVGERDGYAEVPLGDGAIVAFNTGAGDGFYASFWGFDAKGQLAALVTEFRVAGTEVTKGRDILAKHWPGTPPPEPSLAPLFEVGRKFKGGEVVRIDVVGALDLPSGVLLVGPAVTPVEEPLGEDEDPADHEPFVPEKRMLVLDDLPGGTFEVRVAVNLSRRGKKQVETPNALYVAFRADAPVRWTTGVPANLGDGVSLAFEAPSGGPLGLYDGSLAQAVDAAENQARMRAALEDDQPWKAAAFEVHREGGAPLRAVGVMSRIMTDYVFIGRGADGAVCCAVVPLGRDGSEVTRSMSLAAETRKELAREAGGEADE